MHFITQSYHWASKMTLEASRECHLAVIATGHQRMPSASREAGAGSARHGFGRHVSLISLWHQGNSRGIERREAQL